MNDPLKRVPAVISGDIPDHAPMFAGGRRVTLQISGPAPTAAQPLLKRLQEFACMTAPTGGPCEPPALSLRLAESDGTRLAPQGFRLTWNPGGDPADMFDPYFTWHGDAGTVKISAPLADPPRRGTLVGADEAGLLYGLTELLERCEVRGCLPPRPLEIRRAPVLPLRSACLQLMKRGQYILPVTKAEFPWFFDPAWCTRYLDFLLEHRFNALTLWNFHPFPYFCRIDNHPEVVELDDETLAANAAHLSWLLEAATARGIRVLWHFYNVYVCPSYARTHHLKTLHNQFTRAQESRVFAYIRDSVRSFANAFPEAGFVACAGEGVPAGKAERFVADVLVAGLNETAHHPRLVVRQWSSLSASRFERDVVGRYDNLWTMIKHNAEHIAGTVPDARVRDWVATGVPTIVNLHMLSEVGPFRWSPPSYIREICLHYKALGVQGVHVYPHWPWRTPEVGDRGFTGSEMDRDWLYHAAWGRYSFDPVRDPDEERRHWIRRARRRGLPPDVAAALVDAYEAGGAALPRLQQHLWAHYDNHSVLPAGLTLGQLRGARSPHGRKVIQTDRIEDLLPLRVELQGESCPDGVIRFDAAAARSVQELDRAVARLELADFTRHGESARLHADLKSMKWSVDYLRQKARIAGLLSRYDREGDGECLRQAAAELPASLALFRAYRDHAEPGYEGISDVRPCYPAHLNVPLPYTWSDCLAVFEQEAENVHVFATAAAVGAPWSLVHYARFLQRNDPCRELGSHITAQGGHWLTGDPDFLPWSRHLGRMRTLVLLPSASYDSEETSVLSDPALLRRWVVGGGHLLALTLPDLPWAEVCLLAQILEDNGALRNPKTIEQGPGRFLTVKVDEKWTWHRRAGDRGLHGSLHLGNGCIEFRAADSPSP